MRIILNFDFIDKLVVTIRKWTDAPSVYYMVVSSDSVICDYSVGFDDIIEQKYVDEHSQFALFSITKTFTATAILQLQEQGKLNIDDMASIYLPMYSFLNDITIRQLLSHQSGLNNPLPISWIHLENEDNFFNYKGFSCKTLQKKAKNKYIPGEKVAYSNLNYLLLGEIIENVSGENFETYIFENLLFNNNEIGFKWDKKNAVKGYHNSGFSSMILGLLLNKKKYTSIKEDKFIPFKRTYVNGLAYGGINASAKGLKNYLQEFLKTNSKILGEQSKKIMFDEQLNANGQLSGHSLGWFTGKLNDQKYVCHAGGGGGFYAEMRIYPEKGIASFMLTNKSGFNDKRILDKLDNIVLYKLH